MREMYDDEETRRALRTLGDEPAPPASTTLDHVLRSGRRRVFRQRAGAVAGVVAVVAGIGVGTMLLRQNGSSGDTRVGDTASAASPGGWHRVSTDPAADGCPKETGRAAAEPDIELLPEQAVRRAFTAAVKLVSGKAAIMVSSSWEQNPPTPNAPRGVIIFDVREDTGGGHLQIEATRFGDTPSRAADRWSATYGRCEAPERLTLEDGTVLQLYPPLGDEPTKLTQQVQVFQPSGRMYTISSVSVVENGVGKLLIAHGQLAAVAEKFAAGVR